MSAFFNPTTVEQYRKDTQRLVASLPRVTVPYRTCALCKKQGLGYTKAKGSGTSRHNPIRWLCEACKS